MQSVAEHVYSIENGKLGWREPRSDGHKGGGHGKTDIYLDEIGGALFGYAAPDRGQGAKAHRLPRHLHGYLVLDNDYDPFEFPGTTPEHDLEVTFAHEYNHILQFGYDAYQDAWFAESTAVWMEDQVYNGINDYLRYVRRWVKRYDTPLTANSIKEYGSAVWNKWLGHRYGRHDRPPAPGRGPSTPGRGASRSPPTTRRSGPPAARTSAATSPASPATCPSGAPTRSSPRATPTPTSPARGSLPLDGRVLRRAPQPHHLPATARARPPRAGASWSTRVAPRGHRRRPGAGRADRQRAPRARRQGAALQRGTAGG